MCGRPGDVAIQVMIRAIAAGVVGTPERAAAWALEEADRLRREETTTAAEYLERVRLTGASDGG